MANFKDIMAMCLDGASYAVISAALGCSNRDIAKAKSLIADLAITKESFAQLDPGFFDRHFSDHRGARRERYDRECLMVCVWVPDPHKEIDQNDDCGTTRPRR